MYSYITGVPVTNGDDRIIGKAMVTEEGDITIVLRPNETFSEEFKHLAAHGMVRGFSLGIVSIAAAPAMPRLSKLDADKKPQNLSAFFKSPHD